MAVVVQAPMHRWERLSDRVIAALDAVRESRQFGGNVDDAAVLRRVFDHLSDAVAEIGAVDDGDVGR